MTSSSRGKFRDKASHIWMGRGNSAARLANTSAEVFAGVFAAGKEQRDLAAFLCGNDARREDAGPARQFRIFDDTLVIEELENLHRCVVVVEHLAGGALPNKLLESRLTARGAIAHDFPLGGSRQRYAEIAFEPFESMKRKPAAVLHQRHHGRGGPIVFLRAYAFGSFRREHIATCACSVVAARNRCWLEWEPVPQSAPVDCHGFRTSFLCRMGSGLQA